MKLFFACPVTAILVSILLFSSCDSKSPMVSPSTILKNDSSFLVYNRDYLRLSEDFQAFDENTREIKKGELLKKMATGNYIPLRLEAKKDEIRYMLYKLPAEIGDDIREVIGQYGGYAYDQYRLEGTQWPAFKYTDLDGKVYTSANTKGKILVLKFWYISCSACNAEIPMLNDLVNSAGKRKDIEFLSISGFDSAAALRDFSKKTVFRYAMAVQPESYVIDTLHIRIFPTHIILNRQGKIAKVVTEGRELITALNTEAGK